VYGDTDRCRLLPAERAWARLQHRHPAVTLPDLTEAARDEAPSDRPPAAGTGRGHGEIKGDLLALAGATPHPSPSSPQDHTGADTTRPDLIRRLAGILSSRHFATVHALYDRSSNRWSVAWEHPEQTRLTRALLAEAAASDDELEPLIAGRDRLRLGDRRLDLIVWARRMALLDSLVNPEKPVTAEPHADLGITGTSPTPASRWPEALPGLRRITRARALLTYNESYDCGVISEHTGDSGDSDAACDRPVDPSVWSCLLGACSAWWQGRSRYRSHTGDHTRSSGRVPASARVPATPGNPEQRREHHMHTAAGWVHRYRSWLNRK
jgi:DNA polymerase III epsilon subunit-like protein